MPPDTRPSDADTLADSQDRVRGLARSLVRDYDQAEDVVQEAALRFLTGRAKPRRGLSAYLAGIVRNVASKRRRSDRRRATREAVSARPEAEPSTLDLLARLDEQRVVLALVRKLREPYRTAILLRFFEGLPPREIARRQDVPVETAKSRIKRGLAQLRVALDAEHDGDRRAWIGVMLPIGGWPTLAAGAAGTGTSILSTSTKGGLVAATTSQKLALAAVALVILVGGGALYATGVIGPGDDDASSRSDVARSEDALDMQPGLEGGQRDPIATPGPDEDAESARSALEPPREHTDDEAPPSGLIPTGSFSHVPPVRHSPFAPPQPKSGDVPNTWAPGRRAGGGGMGPTGHWTRFPLAKPPKGRARLAVKVVDENGIAIEDADVIIGPEDIAGVEGISFGDVRKLGKTDKTGKYRHDELTGGLVAVTANVGNLFSGRYGLDARPAKMATLAAGRTADVEIQLPLSVKDLGNVEGSVSDSEGRPLRGISVAFRNNHARTDKQGRYRLLRLPKGTQTVTFSRYGYETVSAEVVIRAGGRATQDVTLAFEEAGKVVIRGEVVGPEGEPVAGAQVYLNVPGDRATFRGGTTGADGRFKMKELPERLTKEAVEVQGAAFPRYGSTRIPFENGIPDGTEVRIQINERFVDLILEVQDAGTGAPVSRVKAEAVSLDDEARRKGSFWWQPAKGGLSGIVQPGRYRVTVEGLVHEDTTFDLDIASEDTVRHQVKLKRIAPDAVDVHVQIDLMSSATEHPVGTAKIEILDPTGRPLANYEGTREEGRYLLAAPSGKRVLRISAPGFEPHEQALDLDPMVLELDLVISLRPQ